MAGRAVPDAGQVDALCQDLASHVSLANSVRHLQDWLQAHSGAAEVRLGWYGRGQIQLATRAPTDAGQTSAWQAAMAEAIDQGLALCTPDLHHKDMAEWVTRAQQALSESTTRGPVATLILPDHHAPHPLGALCLVWPEDQPMPSAQELAQELPHWQALAYRLSPLLRWQQQADRPWHGHVRHAGRTAWHRLGQHLRARPWLTTGLLLAALAVMALPWRDQAGGRARIEGAQQRVLAAPSDGYIQAVHSHPGDQVQAGQVLADLAEQDLRLEQGKWTSQVAQQDNSYAAAMTRGDRAEAALALSRMEEAQAQLALVNEQLGRSQLKAPFDGVLIQGDLSQSVGAPVKQGDTLMTVASTKQWRVMIEVDERDIARVRAGQRGEIALSALPWDTMPLRVVRITPLARQVDGRNIFEVEAEFTAPVPAQVRPGLMGQAKVEVDRHPLIWSWLRPVVNRVKLGLWSWLG